ncbi:hypothetical protein EI94DRAFT_1698085 [Lactarius quietus]|nr:hypothetical protein EI94DRAFT_1698085 [Lactarius quietus]
MWSNKLYNAQRPLLMAPFKSNLDTPSGLLTGTLTLVGDLQAYHWFGFVLLQSLLSPFSLHLTWLTTVQTRGRGVMPLPPPVIVESQWGEPRSEAIGTGAVNPDLMPAGGQVGEEESRSGREWQTCRSSNPGSGGTLWLHVESATIYQAGVHGTMLLPPPPLLPFDDLRPLPPPIIAESQWGEPRSEAIGTGACVAGSVVNPDLTPVGGQVGEEESGAGREWQTCRCRHLQAGVCHHPLTTLGHPTLAAIADCSGVSCVRAFGTEAHVAGSSVTMISPAALVSNH